jgi:excisionase family DNA binding protein
MPPKTYTVKEVADILEYSTNSIYTFLKEKRIKGVRVGKGRFRIPQSELDRLLSLSPKQKTDSKGDSSLRAPADVAAQQGDDAALESQHVHYSHIAFFGKPLILPNIFEWFVGISAILSGLALFLFNTSGPRGEATRFAMIMPMARIILVAAGFGVLLSCMFTKPKSFWRSIFHGILSAMGLVNAMVLLRGGDINAALIYGALATLIGATIFVPMGGILATTLYIAFLMAVAPITLVFARTSVSVAPLLEAIPLSFPLIASLLVLASVICIVSIIVGYRRHNRWYTVGMWGAAFGSLAVAFWFGLLNYWSRSFFFVAVSLAALFLPVWRRVQYAGSHREKTLSHVMFGVVSVVLCVAIVVLGLMQAQVWSYNKEEFTNKQVYGAILTDTVFNSAQSVLLAAAQNPRLAQGMKTQDQEAIHEASKVVYEGNEYIRRIVVLDAKGMGLALYPPGTFDQPDFSFRDYFMVARDTRAPYVSNLFQAQADRAGRYVVTVSVPVVDEKTDEFVGVIAGSVDLDRLANRLQQVAIEERGEFFVVADERGTIVIHPTRTRVNQPLREEDMTRLALDGKQGVEQGVVLDGKVGMVAYGPVPSLGWAVSLRAPSSSVLALNESSYIALFTAIAVSILSGCLFMMLVWVKDRRGSSS